MACLSDVHANRSVIISLFEPAAYISAGFGLRGDVSLVHINCEKQELFHDFYRQYCNNVLFAGSKLNIEAVVLIRPLQINALI